MKKLLIGILILGSMFTFAGCGKDSSQNAEANNQTQQSTIQQDSSTNKTDENKTDNKDIENKNKGTQKSISKNKDSKNTKDSTILKKEIKSTKTTKTPSKNTVVETRVKETKKKTTVKNSVASKYYGTWRIEKVIGETKINSNNKTSLGKTLIIGKNTYSNNAFDITIENPKYLIAKISEKSFCRGYNINSLKGTGLNEGTITALDITSSSNPNSDFDELYIQDGYLVYLQDGVFFKCVKE